MTLFDECNPVVVFPHHFAPSIRTAPFNSKRSFNMLSYILFCIPYKELFLNQSILSISRHRVCTCQ